tara:strand:- start:195 stop:527 length:333 start_codon:yes stop_codon:yes gene_type:complete
VRYNNQQIFINDAKEYQQFLKKRGVKFISQYNTPKFKHPDASDAANFNTFTHIWKTGDRFYKLADQYYSNPELWWIIALYNQSPTEFHVKLGDIIYVPTPLETVLYYIGY